MHLLIKTQDDSCRNRECKKHRLIKITDRSLNVVFSRFICFSFTITLRPKPKGVTRGRRRTDFLSVELQVREKAFSTPTTRNCFRRLTQGYCEGKTHKS